MTSCFSYEKCIKLLFGKFLRKQKNSIANLKEVSFKLPFVKLQISVCCIEQKSRLTSGATAEVKQIREDQRGTPIKAVNKVSLNKKRSILLLCTNLKTTAKERNCLIKKVVH